MVKNGGTPPNTKEPFLFIRRPRNIGWPGKTVFLLYEDSSMRWLAATRLIVKCNGCVVRAEWIEDNLPRYTAPNFNDISLHSFIFPVAGADVHIRPFNGYLILIIACCAAYRGRRVIGRLRQPGNARIHNWQSRFITGHLNKIRIDPAFIFAVHINPVVAVGASDQFDVGSFDEAV